MHVYVFAGKSQTTELVIGSGAGSRVVSLGNDEIYNYDDPILHEYCLLFFIIQCNENIVL
jgi:hypothetical protein